MMGGGTVIITRCESQEDSQTIEGRDALFRKLMNDPSVDAEWEWTVRASETFAILASV